MSEPVVEEFVEDSGTYDVAAPVEHVQENAQDVEVEVGAGESLDVELDDDSEPADVGE